MRVPGAASAELCKRCHILHTAEHEARIRCVRRALHEGNIDGLRELCCTDEGLLCDKVRAKAWAALLGAAQPPSTPRAAPWRKQHVRSASAPAGPSEAPPEWADQVHKDIERSLWHVPARARPRLRAQLTRVISRVLSSGTDLYYFQGFHDVCGVLLLVSGREDRASELAEALSRTCLRQWLAPTMQPVRAMLGLLIPLLAEADPEADAFLEASGVQPLFALSWVLTWFSHTSDNVRALARMFDFFIASREPLAPVYASAAMVLRHRERLLRAPCDAGSVHSFFASLPEICEADAIELVHSARRLLEWWPPEKLQGHARAVAPAFFAEGPGSVDDFHVARRIAAREASEVARRRRRSATAAVWVVAVAATAVGVAVSRLSSVAIGLQ